MSEQGERSGQEPALAYTVHFKGNVYPAGTEASQIGEVANELGDHVWKDGNVPAKVRGEGNPLAATPAGRPGPPASALPTPGARIDPPEGDQGDGQADSGEGGEGGSARSGRRPGRNNS